MRCDNCAKMVSYDTDVEPEVQDDPSFEGDTVSFSVRRVLTCQDCGSEMKETTLDFNLDMTLSEDKPTSTPCEDGHEWELDGELSLEPTTEMQTKDRHGKPIKSARYMKTMYGVEASGEAVCQHCGQKATFSGNESCQASGFDELM